MERIAIIGISLGQTDVARLEAIKARTGDVRRFTRLAADELGASETVVLSTCNRLEVIFAREEGHLPCAEDLATLARLFGLDAEAAASLHFDAGMEAARRLFRVVCSLDSLVLGEDQILAQAREAYSRAEHDGLCGTLLVPLFQRAFQVGKEARTRTDLSRHPISVASLGIEELRQGLDPSQSCLAILGAGEMASLAARHAADAGFKIACVASRTLASAERLARPFGAQALSIPELLQRGPQVHGLVSATSAAGLVLDAAGLSLLADRLPAGTRLLALDLALPRDLAATQDPRVAICDLDVLRARAQKNREAREHAARAVETLIDHKLETLSRAMLDRRAATTLAEVHGEAQEIAQREISHLSEARFATLSAEQRREVEEWARQAFGRLEHAPLRAIKRWIEDKQATEERP
ncbi:MAG: glutamyl-tRNA reductase [Planctomycetes bacterium]|nr:glutamyl-tRNA reductase [Planctomycetota bacterium]